MDFYKVKKQTQPQSRPHQYRSAGEYYLATLMPELFNLTFSYLSQQDFGRFHQVYVGNARCRGHWPDLAATAQHSKPLFRVFRSKEALHGVLLSMRVDVRDLVLNFGWHGCHRGGLDLDPDNDDIQSHRRSFNSICADGDLELVRQTLERTPADVDSVKGEDSYTGLAPLHCAAASGALHVVQYLCKQGASINHQNWEGNTPLHIAAYQGHFYVIKYLLSEGADSEIENYDEEKPIHMVSDKLPIHFLLAHPT